MMRLDEMQRLCVQDLQAKGIPAASHARDVPDLPAALVAPQRYLIRSLSGNTTTVVFEIYLVAADTGHDLDALSALSDMTSALAFYYGATEFETVSITLANLGGADPLPALKTEINMTFKETEHEQN